MNSLGKINLIKGKINLIYFFVVFFTSQLNAQNIVVKTYGSYKEKEEFYFNDTLLTKQSIVLFLPIDFYDTNFWNRTISSFIISSELYQTNSISIYKVFFEPGACNNCGLRIANTTNNNDSIKYIFYPSCFLSSYNQNLASRALALPSLSAYSLDMVNNKYPFSQLTYQNLPQCMFKPNGEADLETWKPFLNELFNPKFSLEEKVDKLQSEIKLINQNCIELNKTVDSLMSAIEYLQNQHVCEQDCNIKTCEEQKNGDKRRVIDKNTNKKCFEGGLNENN